MDDRHQELLRKINQKMAVALALLLCILVATCAGQFTIKPVNYQDDAVDVEILPPAPSNSPAEKG